VGSRSDTADTESLRTAFVDYRALFGMLLDEGTGASRDAGTQDVADVRPAERTERTRST
jgi:hypothetical protein